jgi:prophage DNA circulation protein
VDVLASLLSFGWKGVYFPTTTFRIALRHDLAVHRYADRDGANVESTGRQPLQFTARIPFINGIERGTTELWKQPLYPDAFRDFLDVAVVRTIGELVHPELGPIQCKLEQADIVWDATKRGGCEVDCTWLESFDTSQALLDLLTSPSPAAAVAQACSDIDQYVDEYTQAQVNAKFGLPKFTQTFSQLAFALRGVIDSVSILQQQNVGKLAAIAAQASQLKDALDRNSNVLNWPIYNALQRAIGATNDLRAQLLAQPRDILLYPVPKDATLGAIAAQTQAALGDLIILNRELVSTAIVPAKTIVRYYAAA